MTLTVPESIGVTEAEAMLELACGLFACGKIGRIEGAKLAGIDFFSFQGALGERGSPIYSTEMLEEEIKTLGELRNRDRHNLSF